MVKASTSITITLAPEDGKDALVYDIVASHTAVQCRYVNGALVPDVSAVTFRVTKQNGEDTPTTVKPADWAAEGIDVGIQYTAGDTAAHQYMGESIEVVPEYKGVRGTLRRGATVIKTVDIPFGADGEDGLLYELMCLNPTVHIDSEGKVRPSMVTVYPFVINGRTRTQLPVNSDSGAKHYLIRRIEAGTTTQALSSVLTAANLKPANSSARFDIVAKEDVTVSGSTYSYADSAILATMQINVQRDGVDGESGAFTSIVFARSQSRPATPTGGTYDNPIPTSTNPTWTDAPESGTAPLWMSRARFTTETVTPEWSVPVPVEDSTGVEFIYSAVESPTAPANIHPYEGVVGSDWGKSAVGAIWMAVAIKNSGAWSEWSITRIKGEKGEDAVSFSVSPSSATIKRSAVAQTVDFTANLYKGQKRVSFSEAPMTVTGLPAGVTLSGMPTWSADDGATFALTVAANADVDAAITVSRSYGGNVYKANVKLTTVGDGSRGPALRIQKWEDVPVGFRFEDGSEGTTYLDVGIYGLNNDFYICKRSHTKAANNGPGSTTANNEGLWQLGMKWDMVATKVLLSDYAVFKYLGVSYVEMKDADGNILCLIKDGKIEINTGVFKDITVDNATITNALIKSGTIASFKINGKSLENDGFDDDAAIVLRNDAKQTYAGIGGNMLPSSMGGDRALGRFENHAPNADGKNFGIMVSAKNSVYENVALHIDGGTVEGLALRTRYVTNSDAARTQLSRYDAHVVALNTSERVIVLPNGNDIDDGHIVRVKRLGDGALKIALPGKWQNGALQYSPLIIYGANKTVTGLETLNVPSVCDAMDLVWCREIVRTVGSVQYNGAWLEYKLPQDW